jgi:hypothetical protein
MGRTTPPPLDVTSVFPELALLARQAVRLHPRTGAPGPNDIYTQPSPYQAPAAASPLVGVLQLSDRDVPELPFPEQTDLFQLLWCPNEHDAPWYGPRPVAVWRRAAEVT